LAYKKPRERIPQSAILTLVLILTFQSIGIGSIANVRSAKIPHAVKVRYLVARSFSRKLTCIEVCTGTKA